MALVRRQRYSFRPNRPLSLLVILYYLTENNWEKGEMSLIRNIYDPIPAPQFRPCQPLGCKWVFQSFVQRLLRGLCSGREADVLLFCAHYMLIMYRYLSSRPLFRFAQHVMAAFFIVRTKVYARENKGVRSWEQRCTLTMKRSYARDGTLRWWEYISL